ncbi:hypothetical protein SAMN06269185_3025 [Natronoarchaeum philippinense]|uniref:Uncharacterized protein n=1 Tax=Natronoarchaeum philippinense TaxID=558529 RepID=A0A285P6T3_NATPI|nr:hypothetical protein [Natronoarchaeum philippinense]SNZ17444.1 hypothetical protein SAMN06269185_3025 [Natronoarchaeum philippinense]
MNWNAAAETLRSLLARIAGHVLLFTGVLLTPSSLWFLLGGRLTPGLIAIHLWGWLCFLTGLSLIYSN